MAQEMKIANCENKQIKLITFHKEYTVDSKIIKISDFIKEFIKKYGYLEPIQVFNIDDNILEKVIDFCNYYINIGPYQKIPKPLHTNNMNELVNPFYAHLVDIPHIQLLMLIEAANFLDIAPLLELVCAKIGTIIKDKSTQELRDFFNITNDLTQEE